MGVPHPRTARLGIEFAEQAMGGEQGERLARLGRMVPARVRRAAYASAGSPVAR